MNIGKSDWNGVCNILNGAEMTGDKFSGVTSPGLHWTSMTAESVCIGCLAKGIPNAALPNTIVMTVAAS